MACQTSAKTSGEKGLQARLCGTLGIRAGLALRRHTIETCKARSVQYYLTNVFDKCPSTFESDGNPMRSRASGVWMFPPTQSCEMFAMFCFHKVPITATLFLGLFNSQGTGLNLLHLPKLTKLLAKELKQSICIWKMFQHFTATQFHCSLLNRFVSHTSLPKSSETNGRSRSIAVQYLACLKRGRLALSSILSQSGAESSWSAKFVGLRAVPAKGLKYVIKGFQQFAN